jgi:hypothetical protein
VPGPGLGDDGGLGLGDLAGFGADVEGIGTAESGGPLRVPPVRRMSAGGPIATLAPEWPAERLSVCSTEHATRPQ